MTLPHRRWVEGIGLTMSWIAGIALLVLLLLAIAHLLDGHPAVLWRSPSVEHFCLCLLIFIVPMSLRVWCSMYLAREELRLGAQTITCPSCEYDLCSTGVAKGCPECGWGRFRPHLERSA
jgi:hypothetical protein